MEVSSRYLIQRTVKWTSTAPQAPFIYPEHTWLINALFLSWTFLPGYFSCYANDTAECLAGTYSTAGSRVCRPCPKGAQCPNNGLSTYSLCANGSYSDVEGLKVCKLCDAGFRCPNVGVEAQEECPNGTYSNSNGSSFCILCPEGHRWEVTFFGTFTSIRCYIHS